MDRKTVMKLPEKQFVVRNSLLIDLFENKHIRTVYHIFLATFIGLVVNTAAYDYLKYRKIILGLKLIRLSFGNIHYSAIIWSILNLFAYMSFACFYLWAKLKTANPTIHKATKFQFCDIFGLFILSIYYVASFRFASVIVSVCELPPASSAIIVLEQTRLLMKVHSFVRSNVPKVLNHKPHSDKPLILPKLSQFSYFLFAPTLIYRDSYPRTKEIRWNFIFFRLLEIIGVVFYFSFVIERFLNPSIREYGLRKFTLNELLLTVFENTITGILVLLGMFFLILHSWQNLFSEFLRFGDRLFYLDWWTCTSVSGYYRTWNVIVQDWLYTYVYKDMYEIVVPHNKVISKFAVFILSAIIHEWVLTYMFGFFFPVLFIEFFVFGSLLALLPSPKLPVFNILFWYALAFGVGLSVDLYGIEFYARLNAPILNPTFKDFFVPRFLTCDCIKY